RRGPASARMSDHGPMRSLSLAYGTAWTCALGAALASIVACNALKADVDTDGRTDAAAPDAGTSDTSVTDATPSDAASTRSDADAAPSDAGVDAAPKPPSGVIDTTFGIGGWTMIPFPFDGGGGFSQPRGISVVLPGEGPMVGEIDLFGSNTSLVGPAYTSKLSKDGALDISYGKAGFATAVPDGTRYSDFYGYARD